MQRVFDYLPPKIKPEAQTTKDNITNDYQVGQRIYVPFGFANKNSGQRGARKLIGVITAIKTESELPLKRLKAAYEILDTEAIFDIHFIEFLLWAANYYHFPPGLVFEAAMPVWPVSYTHLTLPTIYSV